MRVGTAVEWESQSNGSTTLKRGVIVAVVPAHKDPTKHIPPDMKCNSISYGAPRNHESYLVQVGNSVSLYWPRVKQLSFR